MDRKTARFDGGLCLDLTIEDAESVSHQGRCDDDVDALVCVPYVRSQLDNYTNAELAYELKEYGAWDEEELEDREANEARIVWIAGGMIRDEVREASHD